MIRPSDLLAGFALLVSALIFHRHVLFYRGYVFPWDFRVVHVPLATFIAESFRRGEMPLWDPYTYCGAPLFANIQAALFYPPVVLAEAIGAWLGADHIPRLLALAMVAQVVFAGICTYALLRSIGARAGAAWIGGTVFELGCFFSAQAEHMGAMHGATWLPLIWLCVLKLRERIRWRWGALLALALCMTILAGLPQVAVAAFASAVLLAGLLIAWRAGAARSLWVVAAGCGWAVLLAAVQFWPTRELTMNSVAKYRSDWLGSGGGIPASALFSLVVPNYWSVFDLSKFHGPIDLTFLYLYSSIFGLALAVAALAWRPDRWARVFGSFTVLAALAMMGDKTPIGRAAIAALPNDLRIGIHPEYLFCLFSLALAVLAGLGAERFLPNPRVQIVAGLLIALDLILVSSGRPMNQMSLAVEPGFTQNSADGSRDLADQLRRLTGATTPPARFDTAPDIAYTWSSMGPLLGIPTANGCDPLAPERVIQARLSFASGPRWGTCYQVVNPDSPVVGLLNDRFLISRGEIHSPAYTLRSQTGGYRVYENKDWLPRFFLSAHVTAVQNLENAARIVHDPAFRPEHNAVIETGGEPLPDLPANNAVGRVEVLSYSARRSTVRVETPTEAVLVNTDTYYPGWKATIDGRPARIYPADAAFRALRIPAGTHDVEIRFVPRILYWSAAVSLLALLGTIAVLLQRPPESAS